MFWMTVDIVVFLWLMGLVFGHTMKEDSRAASGHPHRIAGAPMCPNCRLRVGERSGASRTEESSHKGCTNESTNHNGVIRSPER